MKKLYFIGSGKMATAIAGGVISSGIMPREMIGAFDPACAAAEAFKLQTGITVDTSSPENGIKDSEAVLIAVKPQTVTAALTPYRELFSGKLLISIAAGITIEKLQQICGTDRIIRVMPNTPALVGKGASAFAVGKGCSDSDCGFAQNILNATGIAMQVKEDDLDAVTALSGSGPAYVFEFIQALVDGGVAEGLTRDTALRLAVQTVAGAAEMVAKTGEHPTALKDKVTSPAGTTSRALELLAERGFAGTVIQAVRAAAARSKELGKC